MEFRRADALRKHKLGHRTGNMPCGHCGKNFLHISALRQHRAMHNGKWSAMFLFNTYSQTFGQCNELNCYSLPPCLIQPVMYVGHAPNKGFWPQFSVLCCNADSRGTKQCPYYKDELVREVVTVGIVCQGRKV